MIVRGSSRCPRRDLSQGFGVLSSILGEWGEDLFLEINGLGISNVCPVVPFSIEFLFPI